MASMTDAELQISIIIPTNNSGQFIQDTCESLLAQAECCWEAVFVDAGSVDRTVEIINSYKDPRFRIQTFTGGTTFALMNRGIMLAQAPYVHLLIEGCIYISPNSLATALKKIEEHKFPDIFYTASYVGDERGKMHLYYLPEVSSYLKNGYQPALLQACFIQTALFKSVGYFRTDLVWRSALEFFCRLQGRSEVRIASEFRVYVEMFLFPPKFLHAKLVYRETQAVIQRYFGLLAAIRWRLSPKGLANTGSKFLLDVVVSEMKGSGPRARAI